MDQKELVKEEPVTASLFELYNVNVFFIYRFSPFRFTKAIKSLIFG